MIKRDEHHERLHELIADARAMVGTHDPEKVVTCLTSTELWPRLIADEVMLKRLVARGLRRELRALKMTGG